MEGADCWGVGGRGRVQREGREARRADGRPAGLDGLFVALASSTSLQFNPL